MNATQIQVGGVIVIDSDGSWVGPTINLNWSDLQGVPEGFLDGVDNDTVLSEPEVEDYITNGALDLAEGTTIGGNILQKPFPVRRVKFYVGKVVWVGVALRTAC